MDSRANKSIEWSVCPAMLSPVKGACVWLFISALGVAIMQTDFLLGLLLFGLLVGLLSSFLFSTNFCISEKGLIAKYPIRTKRYGWDQIRRVKFFDDSFYLFSRHKPSSLDNWYFMSVFYGDKKAEVHSAVTEYLREDVVTLCAG